MKSNWVVTPTTLGNFCYMQISAAIIENSISFNTAESMHGNVSTIMSLLMFSW